jgi:hypothetical protein
MTMSTTTTTDQAERIIATLSAHEVELRRAGIRHLSLFSASLLARMSHTE